MGKSTGQIGLVGLALVLAGATAGCDNTASIGLEGNATASFAARGAQSLLGTRPPNDTIRSGAHAIVVSSVELRVSEIELKGEHGLESEMKVGTTVVGLPVNGAVVTPIGADVEAGTYDEFELKVQTVRVKGTYDGSPFDVTVAVNEDLEMELFPPVVATQDGSINVTVSISFANWFRSNDGTLIDPRALTESIRSRLASNIAASFEAFEDHDRDGDDHDEDGHSGSGRS